MIYQYPRSRWEDMKHETKHETMETEHETTLRPLNY